MGRGSDSCELSGDSTNRRARRYFLRRQMYGETHVSSYCGQRSFVVAAMLYIGVVSETRFSLQTEDRELIG
jgi:hypothetical protein